MPCFDDWKRFSAVLREIAIGQGSQPLSSLEAQKRARAVLTECGYSWAGRVTANGGDWVELTNQRQEQTHRPEWKTAQQRTMRPKP